MRYLRFVLAALAIGAWAAGPLPGASAAALLAPSYQSSEPSKGAMMDEPPSEVTVTFSEPLDQSSWMKVLDECDRVISAGAATIQLNEMTVQIGENTPSGNYEVVYKAVGLAGATGTSGSSFEFMVHDGKPCKGGHVHPPPGKGKDKHKDHDPKHDDHDPGRQDHDDHTPGGSTHTTHTGMPGMTGSTTHSGHTTMPSDGGHGGGHGNHRGGGNHPGGGDEPPPLATGDTIPASADAEAVLVGLGLALAVGVLGGWLLRMSGNLSGA